MGCPSDFYSTSPAPFLVVVESNLRHIRYVSIIQLTLRKYERYTRLCMKRATFSLSNSVAARLKTVASSVAGGNESLLADLAMARLLDLPEDELSRLVDRQKLNRMSSTRSGWNQAFWLVLGDEMGRREMMNNPYASRNYGNFYVTPLFHRGPGLDEEDDPFHPYVGPRTVTPDSPSPLQWTFDRGHSPVAAAETVATKLRELGVECALQVK
jgi:hypothetical protein